MASCVVVERLLLRLGMLLRAGVTGSDELDEMGERFMYPEHCQRAEQVREKVGAMSCRQQIAQKSEDDSEEYEGLCTIQRTMYQPYTMHGAKRSCVHCKRHEE